MAQRMSRAPLLPTYRTTFAHECRCWEGDAAAWRAGGLEIVATPHEQSIDYLLFVHDRHAGNLKAAQQYLDWETGLVDQLDDDERASFRLPTLSGVSALGRFC